MRGSIGLDIIYFFTVNAEIDVLRQGSDQLIEDFYYPALQAALEQGSYKNISTVQDVKNEVKMRAMFGLFGAVLVLPIISLNKKDSAENSVEAMRDENKAEKIADICCSSERFRQRA
ncbi:uncharacterized protein LOC119657576 [Hermetia illucens]|nr:uncharacterized protein LOC119657576 [Hermetia illucens]XP_037920470.1 uncharacterized protein LOC119657576 [Hermetia illucens]